MSFISPMVSEILVSNPWKTMADFIDWLGKSTTEISQADATICFEFLETILRLHGPMRHNVQVLSYDLEQGRLKIEAGNQTNDGLPISGKITYPRDFPLVFFRRYKLSSWVEESYTNPN